MSGESNLNNKEAPTQGGYYRLDHFSRNLDLVAGTFRATYDLTHKEQRKERVTTWKQRFVKNANNTVLSRSHLPVAGSLGR